MVKKGSKVASSKTKWLQIATFLKVHSKVGPELVSKLDEFPPKVERGKMKVYYWICTLKTDCSSDFPVHTTNLSLAQDLLLISTMNDGNDSLLNELAAESFKKMCRSSFEQPIRLQHSSRSNDEGKRYYSICTL
jgi:hypothetical protein